MPEQHAQVGAVVVGRDEEAAVHVGVAPRLMAQQPADAVDFLGRGGPLAALPDGGTGNLDLALVDDPERLAGGVIVGRGDLHRRQSSAALVRVPGDRDAGLRSQGDPISPRQVRHLRVHRSDRRRHLRDLHAERLQWF